MDNAATPSDLIAQRVRDLRKARGMTAADLAKRCAEAGMPRLTAQALYKLEGQRSKRTPRPITVDELLVLAYALDIAPAYLVSGLDDATMIPVTPALSVSALEVRNWMLGMQVLEGGDEELYAANVPTNARGVFSRDVDEAIASLDELRQELVMRRDFIKKMRARREEFGLIIPPELGKG
jgi:transcriptional regulator with XRE-family HTH domain